ncbi:MAG: indole-3-glycerol-phosphate synthase [Chloroflexi bacterium]|nr:indole-3-glycerol-phosphate synthase [Chloroflexota bacterium]
MSLTPIQHEKPKLIDQIVAAKRKELLAKRVQQPLSLLRDRIEKQDPARSLVAELNWPGQHLIAEIVRASPVRGAYAVSESTAELARSLTSVGAVALSVVTESRHFGGGIRDLISARQAVSCPLIRRDFIVHSYQVYESRAYGADAVFLLTALLTTAQIEELMTVCAELGMESVLEVHTQVDLQRATSLRPRLLCLNDWRLEDFLLERGTALELLDNVPENALTVASGNIQTFAQASALFSKGAKAILVGAAMVAAQDRQAKAQELLEGTRGDRDAD